MDTNGQQLADTYVAMLNTHDPDLVDQFVAPMVELSKQVLAER